MDMTEEDVKLADMPPDIFIKNTRHFGIAVVRRLFFLGPKTCGRRLKTFRRLFHPSPAAMWSMLISDDAYFPFFLFYY